MKNYFHFSALAFFCLASTVSAQESIEPKKHNILIEMQVVAIPQELALPLVPQLMDVSKAEIAYQGIQKLLVKGTAKLLGWPMLTTISGQRGVVESVREFRYASEFAPGGVSVFLSPADGQIVQQPTQVNGVQINAVPTAFQTRTVGITLEAEPVLHPDEKTIDLNLVPQNVRLKGMNKVTLEREKTGEKMVVEQPDFDTTKVTTSLTVKSGARTLLSVFKSPEHPDHLELFILTAEVKKLE